MKRKNHQQREIILNHPSLSLFFQGKMLSKDDEIIESLIEIIFPKSFLIYSENIHIL